VFLTEEEKSFACTVCPSVRDLVHSTKPFSEQYNNHFTDLSVQRELGNIRLAEGWVRTSAGTVHICVPICLKFGVQNIHAVRLGHFELRENRRSESRSSLTSISAHIHNSVLSEIRCARFAPTALWVCDNLHSQGRTFVVAVNEVTSSDTCVLWNHVALWERLGTLTECVVGSEEPARYLHFTAPHLSTPHTATWTTWTVCIPFRAPELHTDQHIIHCTNTCYWMFNVGISIDVAELQRPARTRNLMGVPFV